MILPKDPEPDDHQKRSSHASIKLRVLNERENENKGDYKEAQCICHSLRTTNDTKAKLTQQRPRSLFVKMEPEIEIREDRSGKAKANKFKSTKQKLLVRDLKQMQT